MIEDLQKVYIYVYPDDDCERIHAQTGPTNRTCHICAGVPQGGKGQCSVSYLQVCGMMLSLFNRGIPVVL